ncbi:putative Overproducer of inositol protein 10 likeputative [Trypanosoma vivax]|nr:putative Overproducer of inositol protein 10 likeputative [Trypanosoma vivax]
MDAPAYTPPPQPPVAVIVPGCPVLTQFQCIDGIRWIASLGNAPASIVVFLTAPAPLPFDAALGIYLAREDSGAFEYIGYLSNAQPSAIMRVPSIFLDVVTPIRVFLGISSEREQDMKNLGQAPQQEQERTAVTLLAMSERLVEDLYNFVTSYGRVIPGNSDGAVSEETIFMPISFVDRWRNKLLSKLRNDTSFWSR